MLCEWPRQRVRNGKKLALSFRVGVKETLGIEVCSSAPTSTAVRDNTLIHIGYPLSIPPLPHRNCRKSTAYASQTSSMFWIDRLAQTRRGA